MFPPRSGCLSGYLAAFFRRQAPGSCSAAFGATKFPHGNSSRVLPSLRVVQRGTVQLLPDGLLDHAAGGDGEIVGRSFALGLA